MSTREEKTELIEGFGDLPVVPVHELHLKIGATEPLDYPERSLNKPFEQWRMEDDDSPIFRYLYRQLAPKRHLEFGTWKGEGTCYVLEESPATVWTLNAPFGERLPDGRPAYSASPDEVPEVRMWAAKIGWELQKVPPTDTVAFIGRKYLLRDYGHRVCQIYADSRRWDISNYPAGFFDTCLIDGGHDRDVVLNDTEKALRLVRPGGMILWHDFCPVRKIVDRFATARGVVTAIRGMRDFLRGKVDLFWIEPSYILAGIRR